MPAKRLDEQKTWEEIVEHIMSQCNRKENTFRKWLLGKKECGGYMFSSFLWRRAYKVQNTINKNDGDEFTVIAGLEGSGKSTLGIQLACIVDPTFNISRVCYEPGQFIKGIKKAERGQAFVLDEGNLFLFSRESMSDDNRIMLKLFALMRQKNLCVIICVPNFFTLDSYVRDHRTNTLIWLHKKANFRCFVGKAIRIISKEGSRFKQISGIKVPDGTFFNGSFNSGFPTNVPREDYLKYKSNNFNKFLDDIDNSISEREGMSKFISISKAQKILKLDRATYIKKIKQGEIKGKMVAGKWFVSREYLESI
jgi:hypothetical protein